MIPIRKSLSFVFLLWAAASVSGVLKAEIQEKRLVGTVTGVLREEKKTKLFVTDRENIADTVLVPEEIPIKKQIDLQEIKPGEYAGVIFEEQNGEHLALSTSVGPEEKVEMDEEELASFAPTPDIQEAPEIPRAPEVPSVPEADQQGPPPGEGAQPEGGPSGEGGGQGRPEETGGFSPEELAEAKGQEKKKGPLDDVLAEESPLTQMGEGAVPSFVSGKIVSVDLQGEKPVMVLESSSGDKVQILLGPQLLVVNRYLEVSNLTKGNQVDILYEEKEKDKLARSILVAKDTVTA